MTRAVPPVIADPTPRVIEEHERAAIEQRAGAVRLLGLVTSLSLFVAIVGVGLAVQTASNVVDLCERTAFAREQLAALKDERARSIPGPVGVELRDEARKLRVLNARARCADRYRLP